MLNLLVVDDEKILADALAMLLRNHNYKVDVVNDGEQALEIISKNTYNAILLDISMPKKSGLEVTKEIREKGLNVPILIMSASDDYKIKEESLKIGANDYMEKPFTKDEILEKLNRIIKKILI